MGTTIRNIISKRSPWWISKYRRLELVNWCRQYGEWKKRYAELEERIKPSSTCVFERGDIGNRTDTTAKIAIEMAYLKECIELLEKTAMDVDDILGPYVFKAATEGVSYPYLNTVMKIPCGRNYFYDIYRKFFWMLSQQKHVL